MRKRSMIMPVAGFLVIAAPALAQLDHEGDVGWTIRGGKLVPGRVVDNGMGETVLPGRRVFASEFIEVGPLVVTDEPGMAGEAGVFPNTSLQFNISGPVLAWDGGAFTSPSLETISVEFGPNSATSGAGAVPGFGIPIGPAGFDEHYEFFLNAPSGTGIYLLPMDFSLADPNVNAAKTLYIVFNYNDSELEHDEAIDWTVTNLVPSPDVGLAGIGGMLLARRRR